MPRPLIIKFFVLITACAYAVAVRAENQVPVEPKANNAIPHNSNWYQHQYASPYTIISQPHAIARDSYSEAATDLGYGAPAIGGGGGGGHGGGDHGHGQPSTYHYQVYPGGGGHSGGYGPSGDDDEGGFGGGGGSGIGLLGLLGLKGLKGLKVVKAAKAAAILAPVLGPILGPLLLPILAPLLLLLLAPLLLLPLLLLFIPIPVVTIPGRRSFSWRETARMAQDALTNEECFERITCEAVRVARGYGFDAPWVKNYFEKSAPKNKWIERMSRAAQATECKTYTCGLVNPVKKILKIN